MKRTALLFALACSLPAWAGKAHEHGAARLDVAVDGGTLTIALDTPLDGLLVETDAPFLTPMPYRGRPNASYLIPLTVRALAEITGHELAALCAAISANGDRAFGAWR